jgi:GNAT superfamily N-acetyltransferase
MWYKLAQAADFRSINPEEDWEEAEQSDQIFRQNDIRYGRDKDISQIAVENGVVIGALASGWLQDNSYGEDVMVFSFDLVVKPEFRRQGVGLGLIQQALRKYNQEKMDYQEMGNKTMMRVWVVNPILIPVLEKLGFTIESSYEVDEMGNPGSAHLIAY